MQSTASGKLTDVLSPLPINAYTIVMGGFALIIAACGLIAAGCAIAVFALAKRGASFELLAFLILVAGLMIFVIIIAVLTYPHALANLNQRRDDYSNALPSVIVAMQQIAYVDVRGKGNSVTLEQAPQITQNTTRFDSRATETYRVAQEIYRVALESWNAHNGKPVTPKPFSEEIISARLEVGGMLWTDGAQLCEDALLIHHARSKGKYAVLVTDARQAEQMLHAEMRKRGKTSLWRNGQQTWNTPALLAPKEG